ncbi:Protein of unknown function [Gryllus bimaculatus]|nr:Protein of unknown function [Gryllus bimaculatus]
MTLGGVAGRAARGGWTDEEKRRKKKGFTLDFSPLVDKGPPAADAPRECPFARPPPHTSRPSHREMERRLQYRAEGGAKKGAVTKEAHHAAALGFRAGRTRPPPRPTPPPPPRSRRRAAAAGRRAGRRPCMHGAVATSTSRSGGPREGGGGAAGASPRRHRRPQPAGAGRSPTAAQPREKKKLLKWRKSKRERKEKWIARNRNERVGGKEERHMREEE